MRPVCPPTQFHFFATRHSSPPQIPSTPWLRAPSPPLLPPLPPLTPSLVPSSPLTQRRHVLEWVRAMIAVALGVPLHSELPPIYIQEATEDAQRQISEYRAIEGPGRRSVRELQMLTGGAHSHTLMWCVEGGTHLSPL